MRAPRTRRRVRRKAGLAVLRIALLILLTLMVMAGVAAAALLRDIINEAPDISSITVAPTQAATYIYDQAGVRVQKLTLPEANRDLVTIDRIPIDLQHAVVAIEDERFYQHKGIDPKGILRAVWIGVSSGSFSEGASTITQQLLKNSVFTGWMGEVTFTDRLRRKIQEQYLALKLEKILTKEQILEDYLNTINLGAGCYGVQSAAYTYFGKDVSELTLSESAVIAGITQNPTAYNPIVNPDKNRNRRQAVLDHMLDQGYISREAYDEALADNVYERIQSNEAYTDSISSVYTYYQDALIDQVIEDLMNEKGYTYKQAFKAVYTGGLRIYSAQDDQIQQICDEEFENPANFPDGTEVGIDYALSIEDGDGQVTNYSSEDLRAFVRANADPQFDLMCQDADTARGYASLFRQAKEGEGDTVLGERITITPQPQASITIIDQSTGYIKAIVGGRGDKDASLTLNRATYTMRQPGSTFKIITAYGPALDACGKTLASTYENTECTYSDGTKVSNWDLNDYTGPVTIREAIIRSINVAAVRCITEITPRRGYEYAKKMGITTLVESYDNGTEILSDLVQPLALGGITKGVTNLELCGAYASIANLGQYVAPKFYTQVLDHYGNVVLDNSVPPSSTVMKPETASLLTDAMRQVITDPQGTANGMIDLGYMPVAGKTGTTSSYKDIWFVGYSPYYTCCVWGGYDNNDPLPDEGIYHTYNKVLWNSVMNRIHADLPVSSLRTSGNLVSAAVCKDTGLAAVPGVCPSYTELFAPGTEPKQYCTVHGDGSVVTDTQSEPQSGLAPGIITIYNSDQTSIGGDGNGGSDQASGQTSGNGSQPADLSEENSYWQNNPVSGGDSADQGTAGIDYSASGQGAQGDYSYDWAGLAGGGDPAGGSASSYGQDTSGGDYSAPGQGAPGDYSYDWAGLAGGGDPAGDAALSPEVIQIYDSIPEAAP